MINSQNINNFVYQKKTKWKLCKRSIHIQKYSASPMNEKTKLKNEMSSTRNN